MTRLTVGRISGAGVLCLTSLLGSCEPMQPADPAPDWGIGTYIHWPNDMTTNISSDAPIVIHTTGPYPWGEIEDWVREELPSWHASTRLVRWPSREPVEGRWVFSNDYRMLLTFEPDQPFARGWYAVQYNNSTFRTPVGYQGEDAVSRSGLYWDDGWTTARFHVGEFQYVGLRGVLLSRPSEGREGYGGFGIGVSDGALLERDQPVAGLLRVTVDGEPIACPLTRGLQDLYGEDGVIPAGPFHGLEWVCGEVPRAGRVEVTLQALAFSRNVRYSGRGRPAVWTSQVDERIDERNVDESLFAAEEPEVSP